MKIYIGGQSRGSGNSTARPSFETGATRTTSNKQQQRYMGQIHWQRQTLFYVRWPVRKIIYSWCSVVSAFCLNNITSVFASLGGVRVCVFVYRYTVHSNQIVAVARETTTAAAATNTTTETALSLLTPSTILQWLNRTHAFISLGQFFFAFYFFGV